MTDNKWRPKTKGGALADMNYHLYRALKHATVIEDRFHCVRSYDFNVELFDADLAEVIKARAEFDQLPQYLDEEKEQA